MNECRMIDNVLKFIYKNKYLFLIVITFLFLRLVFLTKLPIFNDESIYLHWGWKEVWINFPEFLYLSLFDGKQPLLLWIFGIIQKFISDPLIAGRLISAVAGLLTLIGIYKIGVNYFNKEIALIAVFLYSIIPLFVFFDRQALMESSVGCIGVWICYSTIKFINKPNKFYIYFLGFLYGIGFFIKTTPLIFTLSSLFLIVYSYFKTKNKQYIYGIIFSLVISQLILLPLYNQVDAINILKLSSRYTLTVGELINLPFSVWISNVLGSIEIIFFHVSPFLFLFTIIATSKIPKKKGQFKNYPILFFLTNLVLFLLTSRTPSIRYIEPFLPLSTLCMAAFINANWNDAYRKIFIILAIIIPFSISIAFVFSPSSYFSTYQKLTKFSNKEYFSGFTSGFGVVETGQFLTKLSNGKPIHVEVRGDSGNPEDAMFVYLRAHPNIKTTYLDFECKNKKAVFKGYLKNIPTYFVSRDGRTENLKSCMTLIKKNYKPDKKNYIGIFKVNF